MSDDLSGFSMQELFRVETENQAAVLTEGLLVLERDPRAAEALESLMRAAHSIKGAARIINLDGAVGVAHAMEDCFVAAQTGQIVLAAAAIDVLLSGVDMLTRISIIEEGGSETWFNEHESEISALVQALASVLAGETGDNRDVKATVAEKPKTKGKTSKKAEATRKASPPSNAKPEPAENKPKNTDTEEAKDRVLRVSSEHLDRMLALASEMQVEWQWLKPFSDSMLHLKRRLAELEKMLIHVETSTGGSGKLDGVRDKAAQCRETLAGQQAELELHTRSISSLSHRLFHQTVASRMRPFADGVHGFKRMVRDLARNLGKQVRLEISGLDTTVDRDILEKIESPLNHLIRNAIDHGIESPEERKNMGKPEEGLVHIEAIHQAGMLRLVVSDDGRGLDLDALKQQVVDRNHASEEMVERMTESELMSFLFLPRFSMKEEVTEISGRGVGLDVVANMIREVRGTMHSSASKGAGMRFELRLPITLSVIRALLVEIDGEPYAFPLVHIDRTLKCRADDIERVEGRQYISLGDQQIGLISAREVLGLPREADSDDLYSVVVLGDIESRYGLIVDRLLGERDLVEKVLSPRLGKVKDISAAAVTSAGSPLLIFDVNDLLRSIAKLINAGKLGRVGQLAGQAASNTAKRILVVDDSITVREVERKLLVSRGYEVEVAVDGIDGLNSARSGHYDLVISDVDMPRMDGIEFVRQIKSDAKLRDTPVVIVSYKESDEDRMRGLDAGADSYLTKSSFHDETLLDTVTGLIGKA
ncbi:MAG: hybrid sensor histidine kinase/response regulator [Mariprofundaceae bacterium]